MKKKNSKKKFKKMVKNILGRKFHFMKMRKGEFIILLLQNL